MTLNSLSRILIIEDEPDIQLILKTVLETQGRFQVRTCKNGQSAFATLSYYEPELILLDVMMPDMDGLTIFRLLREMEQTSRTPVIFITARVQPYEVEQYRRMGAAGVIAKPFNPMTLIPTIKSLYEKIEPLPQVNLWKLPA